MVRSYWKRTLVSSVAWAGLALSQQPLPTLAQMPANADQPIRTITVQEVGKSPLRCKVLKTWKTEDGSTAHQVQAFANGEMLTVVEMGLATRVPGQSSSGKLQAVSTQIYHWGRGTTPPPGCPVPSGSPVQAVAVAPQPVTPKVAARPEAANVAPVVPARADAPSAQSAPAQVASIMAARPETPKAAAQPTPASMGNAHKPRIWPPAHGKAAEDPLAGLPLSAFAPPTAVVKKEEMGASKPALVAAADANAPSSAPASVVPIGPMIKPSPLVPSVAADAVADRGATKATAQPTLPVPTNASQETASAKSVTPVLPAFASLPPGKHSNGIVTTESAPKATAGSALSQTKAAPNERVTLVPKTTWTRSGVPQAPSSVATNKPVLRTATTASPAPAKPRVPAVIPAAVKVVKPAESRREVPESSPTVAAPAALMPIVEKPAETRPSVSAQALTATAPAGVKPVLPVVEKSAEPRPILPAPGLLVSAPVASKSPVVPVVEKPAESRPSIPVPASAATAPLISMPVVPVAEKPAATMAPFKPVLPIMSKLKTITPVSPSPEVKMPESMAEARERSAAIVAEVKKPIPAEPKRLVTTDAPRGIAVPGLEATPLVSTKTSQAEIGAAEWRKSWGKKEAETKAPARVEEVKTVKADSVRPDPLRNPEVYSRPALAPVPVLNRLLAPKREEPTVVEEKVLGPARPVMVEGEPKRQMAFMHHLRGTPVPLTIAEAKALEVQTMPKDGRPVGVQSIVAAGGGEPVTVPVPMMSVPPVRQPEQMGTRMPVRNQPEEMVNAFTPPTPPLPPTPVPAATRNLSTPTAMPVPVTQAGFSRVIEQRPPAAILSAEKVSEFVKALKDADLPSQREYAAENLCKVDAASNPGVVAALLSAAKSDPAVIVRACCIRSLARMKAHTPAVTSALQTMKSEADAWVRIEADLALQSLAASAVPVKRAQ